MKYSAIVASLFVLIAVGFVWFIFFTNNLPSLINKSESTPLPAVGETPQTKIITGNMDTPWGIVSLPEKYLLVTQITGVVRKVKTTGHFDSIIIARLNKVREIGEGGLLGITIHPDFLNNNYVYLYYTYSENNGNTLNRVVRMTYQSDSLSNEQIIVDKIPGASNHNGGRIKFGPDGYLYITTGDAENPSQAQDTNALGGKILRVTSEGKTPQDNPFNNPVYSYGHRNPQGLAWDSEGRLWATEHGRSGIQSGFDEINLIEKGKNYGWPVIQGDEMQTGMEAPKLHSGATATWAPAGAAFINNSLFFGGLRGEALYEAVIDGDIITLKEHFKGQYGRIREVVSSPDNKLYITTSNRDGRGEPSFSDDRIIRINPEKL